MHNWIKYISLFLLIAILPAHDRLSDEQKNKFLIEIISQSIDIYHYNPQNIDDTFSEMVFTEYLKNLDRNKRFLLAADYEMLLEHKTLIDNQIQSRSFTFFNISEVLYQKRFEKVDEIFEKLLAQPFNYELKEEIELDGDKLDFTQNEEELEDRWRKMLKYQVIKQIESDVNRQEKALETNDTSITQLTFEELEVKAREKVLETHKSWYHRMEKINTEDRLFMYLNTIAAINDPHTNYFPPKDRENFNISMAGKLEGIGATLQESDGYIKVVRIVPGSPSWKQGDLKEGDLILKVAQGNEESVDIVDMRLDEAVLLIRGDKGTEVRLTVKKIDGSTVEIPIIRDVVEIEETYAKSAILTDAKEKSRVGYIYLPKFYADFSDKNGRHCAIDVKEEITKLKNENIDGIILDLRNNGGGSLPDVVDMAGLFIEKGPIVQVKARKGDPRILSDSDPKVHYDGPLVVMVNSFSASASEILAAAIQDYKRGIIIGSNSTYGKGTVQRFVDFDDAVPKKYDDIKPLGSIKMTIQKFYRVTGTTTQLKGVVPDIILPDAYSYVEIGEKELDHAMKWDEIPTVKFSPHEGLNYSKILKKSQKRIEKNEFYALMDENALRMKNQRNMSMYSLNYEQYVQDEKIREQIAKKYKSLNKFENNLQILSLQQALNEMANDTIKQAVATKWHQELKKDVYLEEAFEVIGSM